jgi:hypothetical protein
MDLPLPAALTIEEAEEFIRSAPWRQVRQVPEGPAQKPPDPHEYVILDWPEVDGLKFAAFARLIHRDGYSARYTPPYRPDRSMVGRYLQIGDWIFWHVYPNQLCRQRAEDRQHEPIPIQPTLEVDR